MQDQLCTLCGNRRALFDDHGHCERCVLDAEERANKLNDVVDAYAAARRAGLSAEQLAAAMAGATGTLPGDFLVRRGPSSSRTSGTSRRCSVTCGERA
jgi:hypothetical protein